MSYNTFQPIVTRGLVYYIDPENGKSYPGSGLTCSSLVDGNSGSLMNGLSVNKYFNFDGIDDYIAPTLFDVSASGDFTFDMIVKIGSSQVAYADIFDYDHANSGFVIQQWYPYASNQWYFAWYVGYGYEFFYMTLPVDEFFHFTMTKFGGNFTYYINGSQTGSYTGTSTITATGKNCRVGDFVGGGRNFNGSISSFKIYGRSLSANEVKQNYLAQKMRFLG